MRFNEFNFDNHFEKLGSDFFARALPTPLKNQKIVTVSKSAAALLDLDSTAVKNKNFLAAISGKNPHPKFSYLAQIYGGHQFGHYAGQLGDGRAILLAQLKNKKNESWDLVLKGCGLTPYSRPHVQNADGKSVLRSAIREFLISESMFHLGIPTSRALCLISSDDIAIRETVEPAAQIIRLAPSHVRFGTFEFFFYQPPYLGKIDKIKILADYVISQNFSAVKNYSEFLQEVVTSTAKLVAKWQAYGFCHGVLNTDNMSVHGITFDYGPFGFLNEYNPHHICNHSDQQGRYSFTNQPAIGFWNLNAFAITLSSLIPMAEIKKILATYEKIFRDEYENLMANKLGFARCDEEVKKLIYELLDLLEKTGSDYAIFFRSLADKHSSSLNCAAVLGSREVWHKKYEKLLQEKNIKESARKKLMNRSNPKFIPRNHLLQTAIEKAYTGDFSEVKKLQKIFEKPFAEQKKNESYADLPPAWAKEIEVSCSS